MRYGIIVLALNWLVGITVVSAQNAETRSLGTPQTDTITWPAGMHDNAAAVELGRHLFFDPRLVLNEQQSCASCHSPHMGYAAGVALEPRAHKDWALSARNSPTLYNLAWAPVLHWDGRTPNGQCFTPEDTQVEVCLPPLESQAFKSMRSRNVYEGFLPKVAAQPEYQVMFKDAFPKDGDITHLNMAKAIAAFERTIISENSPFDRYIAGDEQALTTEASRGLALFKGKANCTLCHHGEHFTDWQFHNIGVASADSGRGERVQNDDDKSTFEGAFKTPGLRNAALTAPYMHDGSLGSLDAVIAFYNRGGDSDVNRSSLIQPLALSAQEQWDLIAFLHALTDPVDVVVPVIPGLSGG